ncbi:(2Fe-2S)-binding protein [Desulfosporosinus sp. Sb-LF]|nr:(2Fe-2S)-binding protein [Desulfosporosinus sp. Sb-LF]
MLEIKINPEVNNPCPLCGNLGQKVKNVTVDHQLKDKTDIYGEQFFICRTPECETGYYTQNGKIIRQGQLINKIWFKKNISSPTPICYCANVTEEEILYHVAEARCCSALEDIKRHTGANTGCECITKNPAGG